MAIDSKLRGCDLVKMKVVDVMASGQIKERASGLQSKTQKPVRFEISEGTRASVEKWMENELMVGSEYLWPAASMNGCIFRPGSTPGSCAIGSRPSGLRRVHTAYTRSDAHRSRRSTRKQATYGQCNFCSATRSWAVLFGILVWSSKMLWASQKPLKFSVFGSYSQYRAQMRWQSVV